MLPRVWHLILSGLLLVGCATPPSGVLATHTEKVCQLTGEADRERAALTVNRTETRYGLRGTDTGAPVIAPGADPTRDLVFLFGDTVPAAGYDDDRPDDGDAVAVAPGGQDPAQCLRLQFVGAPDGRYLAPRVPGITLGGFEIPMAGVELDDLFVFFITDRDHNRAHGRTVLTRAKRDPRGRPTRDFEPVYELSRDKFINVWPAFAADAGQGSELLLFGSGAYRRSNVFLAAIEPARLAERAGWRYFAGTDAAGAPRWSADEADAAALIEDARFEPCVGELSVGWIAPLRKWLMLYNCTAPSGINLRLADRPWGPWSAATVLFAPRDGHCRFMHASWDVARCDAVYDSMYGRDRVNEWGNEYAPYLIGPFTAGEPGRATIYWTMSTWNPYQVVLMRSTLFQPRSQPPHQPCSRGWVGGAAAARASNGDQFDRRCR